jgi:hypothetical protein
MHINDVPELTSFKGLTARSQHAVELAKRICCYSVAKALETQGKKLYDSQEASVRIAEMLAEIYAMECAVVRAGLMTDMNHHWAELGRNLADAYVNKFWNKVQNDGVMLLCDVLEGSALDAALADLQVFAKFIPQSSTKLRDSIALKVIECGGYPIVQY